MIDFNKIKGSYISLEELIKAMKNEDYIEIYENICDFLDKGKIISVKSSPLNGKKPALRYAEEGVNSSNKVIEGLEKERIDYLRYDKGSFMKKDKADLIARYKALNSTLHENIKEIDIKDIRKEKDINYNIIKKIGEVIATLKEYSDLRIKEEVSINLDIKTLSDDIGIKRRDLRNLADKERSELNTLENEITRKLLNNKVFMDNQHFKDPVETIFKLASIPRQLLEQLKVFKDAFKKQMDKLAQDINLIKKEEEKILENILEYIKEVNENLGKIDNNSSIYIKNRSFKMLNIIVPKWDENQEIYKMKLKEYIHQLREQAMMQLRKNESIEDLISSRISNYNLFNEVVSVSSVNIKLYKIDKDK